MLTPRFSLTQDEEFVVVTIFAPFTHLAETEVFMEDRDFRFYSKPYFLRLHLPGEVEENDKASGHYDADSNNFVVKVPKKTPGQYFAGLDMLSQLLRPQGADSVPQTQKVQDVDSDWYVDQSIPGEEHQAQDGKMEDECGYGFGFKAQGVFTKLLPEFQEILEVKNPDQTTFAERSRQRIVLEDSAFDPDHYLFDQFDNDQDIRQLMVFKTPWSEISDDEAPELNAEERERLIGLSKKDITVDEMLVPSVNLGLVDLLFGYVYEFKTTLGEFNSESGWTLSRLSATMCCSVRFSSMKECVVCCVRRALVYPLFRHYELAKEVLNEVQALLSRGSLAVLHVLLAMIPLLNKYEGRHVFNDLYVIPYTLYVQTEQAQQRLPHLSRSLRRELDCLSKEDIGLELMELEQAARLALQEEEQGSDLSAALKTMAIKDSDDDTTDADDGDSDDDDGGGLK